MTPSRSCIRRNWPPQSPQWWSRSSHTHSSPCHSPGRSMRTRPIIFSLVLRVPHRYYAQTSPEGHWICHAVHGHIKVTKQWTSWPLSSRGGGRSQDWPPCSTPTAHGGRGLSSLPKPGGPAVSPTRCQRSSLSFHLTLIPPSIYVSDRVALWISTWTGTASWTTTSARGTPLRPSQRSGSC